MDRSEYSHARPDRPLDVLFIHHSVGGRWLADPGPEAGENCIYRAHPHGGGLRGLMQLEGYTVHEACYGSRIGQNTDLFDWLPKFREQMPEALACDHQDAPYPDDRRNHVVMFKSCFPNSMFVGVGNPPGRPAGGELTVANAQAAYRALLAEFERYRDTLFVCVTTPPLAPKVDAGPWWKPIARRVCGKPTPLRKLARGAALARQFSGWLTDDNGWLKDYPHRNVAVFDYFHVLTDEGASDLLAFPTGDGYDSHPSGEGQQRAAAAFVPFLNTAVRRAGLSG